MDYAYATLTDVIKRLHEGDCPRHIRRQLKRLTSDEIRDLRLMMDWVEIEIYDMENS